MNPSPSGDDRSNLPVFDVDQERSYSLEIVAEITGISSQAIILYQQQGLLEPPEDNRFDDESVRTLRRIEHLRETCAANLVGLKLILQLTAEVERLQDALRNRQSR